MIASREQILSALFTLLQGATFASPVGAAGATTWARSSRRMKLWTDVSPAEKPALFMTDHSETAGASSKTLPPSFTIDVDLFVYIDSADPDTVPSSDLNVVLDAITAALAPTTGGPQTLGGLVTACAVEGRIMKDPGDLDGQGLALVPIKILCP
jgi:hypothetical protein